MLFFLFSHPLFNSSLPFLSLSAPCTLPLFLTFFLIALLKAKAFFLFGSFSLLSSMKLDHQGDVRIDFTSQKRTRTIEFIERSRGKCFSRDHSPNSYRSLELTPWRTCAFLNNAFLMITFGIWLRWEDFSHGLLFLREGSSTRWILLASCPWVKGFGKETGQSG